MDQVEVGEEGVVNIVVLFDEIYAKLTVSTLIKGC